MKKTNIFISKTVVVILMLSQFMFVSPIKLNSDGGYEIVFALEENLQEPSVGVQRFVENVKISMQAFSSRLWQTTKQKFYLKSVDVLLPSKWDTNTPTKAATTQTYQSADVRMSNGTIYPYAENLNPCGQPGSAIDLPYNFFDTAISGPNGLHEKTFLTLWAIYRFGVHSEHGYVENQQFPYLHWDTNSDQLAVTGCSDEPIKGKFVDLTNPDATCDSALNKDCRFIPATRGQNATSSLLHFHWIDTVTEFCDSHNHNKHSPNKQNALCDHKSVWEVIRESSDYLIVTSPKASVPALKVNLIKHSGTPLFYMLLDRGRIQGSISIANLVPPEIVTFITNNVLRKTVAAIGAYPGNNGNIVDDLVEWSEIGENRDAFVTSIGVLKTNGSVERDFSRAVVAVADKIKKKNHPNGAVVLLVNFGADTKSFESYLPEAEVINSLNEGKVIFNSIELNFPNRTDYSHLSETAQQTNGIYTVLNNWEEAKTSIRNVLKYIGTRLADYDPNIHKNWKTLRKDTLSSVAPVSIPTGIKENLEIFVSSHLGNMTDVNFALNGSSSPTGVPQRPLPFKSIRKLLDWKEAGSKYTYSISVSATDMNGISYVTLRVSCNVNNCANNVLVRGQFTGDSEKISINILTSLETNVVDLANGKPVSIFAKILKSGVPVAEAKVLAQLKGSSSSSVTNIELKDDGKFAPDVQERDGIYSGYFAPERDETFELSVTVKGSQAVFRKNDKLKIPKGAFIQLLPVDQNDLGCGLANCDAESLEETFSQAVDFSFPFTIQNASKFSPMPNKILTLEAIDQPDRNQVHLYWESPIVIGRPQISVTSYEIRSATQRDLLIANFDNQTPVPVPPNPVPKPPTNPETVVVSRPATTTYYAVRSIYKGKKSSTSNIVEVLITTKPTPTPTQSTGPTPTTTTTVSDDPSTSTSTTPDDDENPSDPSTSPGTGGAVQNIASNSFILFIVLIMTVFVITD